VGYFIEKELTATNGKKYLQIYISTHCCKRRFLVEVLPNGHYYDVEKMQNVPPGARRLIKYQYDWLKDANKQTQ
jgi:hypothetical protein